MPVIDEDGRIFALVNVVDLLAVLLAIAVVAAGSTLALSQSIAGPITAVVAVASLAGLVLASKHYHDVAWETVRAAVRDAKPSRPARPSLRGLRQWLTTEPDPDVIVIDLRETVTVGPIVLALDRLVRSLGERSRDSS
jgi:hypothetical protein